MLSKMDKRKLVTTAANEGSTGCLAVSSRPAHVTLEPVRWLSVADAVRTRGIGRSVLYELIGAGSIKSSSLRKLGNSRGKRLIHAESLDAFIEAHADIKECRDGG